MKLDTFFRNLRKIAAGKKFRINKNGAIRLKGASERNRHPVNPVTLVTKERGLGNFQVLKTDEAGIALGLDNTTAYRLTNAIEFNSDPVLRNRILKTLKLS